MLLCYLYATCIFAPDGRPMSHPLDEAAPAIAKWLAPYIAAELNLQAPRAPKALDPGYDERTCAIYVHGLGDAVVPRAEEFFQRIGSYAVAAGDEQRFEVDSLLLADVLELKSPRQISSALTNSLKRRAKKLGLPYPWIQLTTGDPNSERSVWAARDGDESNRLCIAAAAERHRRGIPALYEDGYAFSDSAREAAELAARGEL